MIIGQGLAGCLLAKALGERGASCLVIGESLPMSATPVAAGIMNPITGRRLVKSWRTEKYLPFAKNFYRKLSREWDEPLMTEGRILRFPRDKEEIIRFRERRMDPEYTPFLGAEFPPGHWKEMGWKDEGGSYEILEVGWVNLERIATRLRDCFREQGILREETFTHSDLRFTGARVSWGEVEADGIVFCEGARVLDNPWFTDLPFTPSRGETLELEAMGMPDSEILQSGYWLLSSPDGTLRAGATYDHDDLTSGPTERGREQILEGLSQFLDKSPAIAVQLSGLRPSTRDRLPILGRHPQHACLSLFNGFGSKGASWIPPLAQRFADHLLDGNIPLDGEIDLLRFAKEARA
ncbi:MAG: FAD-binding oxidoreductase [Opitutales bacterium]